MINFCSPISPSLKRGVVTREEFASLLRVCATTIDRMHRKGTGPKRIRLSPRRVGYRLEDVRAWLDAKVEGGAADE